MDRLFTFHVRYDADSPLKTIDEVAPEQLSILGAIVRQICIKHLGRGDGMFTVMRATGYNLMQVYVVAGEKVTVEEWEATLAALEGYFASNDGHYDYWQDKDRGCL